MNLPPKKFLVIPYNTKQLAKLYGMDYKTFRKWLLPYQEAVGKRIGYYYNFRQANIFFQKLGTPKKICLIGRK